MLIPSSAYLILAEQTRRLCLPGVNGNDTRRIIRKLTLHFCGSRLTASFQRIAEANLALVSSDDPETYALRCLAAVTRIGREEQQHREMIAKFDGLAESSAKLNEVLTKLSDTMATGPGGGDAQ